MGLTAWRERTVERWAEFEDLVGELMDDSSQESHLFRGQIQQGWSLFPGIVRIAIHRDLPHDEVLNIERELLTKFESGAHRYVGSSGLQHPRNAIDCWALMQHYGAPTRLLDWTGSPYIGLYFAVARDANEGGVLWVCDSAMLKSRREAPETVDEWLSLGRSRGDEMFVVRPTQLSDRMNVQDTYFTVGENALGDHRRVLEERANLRRIIIPRYFKHFALNRLRQMMITGANLFPGIDGFGRELAELAKLAGDKAMFRSRFEEWSSWGTRDA